jgi:hypothetical protein
MIFGASKVDEKKKKKKNFDYVCVSVCRVCGSNDHQTGHHESHHLLLHIVVVVVELS